MRSRSILLVLAILLVAGFVALNWGEVIRPAPLLFGPVVMDAPLAAILLGLLAIATLIFVISSASMHSHYRKEERQHLKALESQRELADKAEASRFTDLRQHLDVQLRELRERDGHHAGESQRALLEHQREVRTQLEQIQRTLTLRLAEIEHRLDARHDRNERHEERHSATPSLAAPTLSPSRETVHREAAHREPALHGAHDPAVHDHGVHAHAGAGGDTRREPTLGAHPVATERVHQQRVQEDQRTGAQDKPAETGQGGWRRWF